MLYNSMPPRAFRNENPKIRARNARKNAENRSENLGATFPQKNAPKFPGILEQLALFLCFKRGPKMARVLCVAYVTAIFNFQCSTIYKLPAQTGYLRVILDDSRTHFLNVQLTDNSRDSRTLQRRQ